MTFDEFITKYKNQPVDFDGVYPNQCMDLMHQYVYDVLGIKDISVLAAPAAYQVYQNFRWGNLFDKIDNTPDGVPQKGDIVFFGTRIGAFGHVCIFESGDSNQFNSFDANWPVGSLPHTQNHSYVGVLGWLRVKNQTAPQPLPENYQTGSGKFDNVVAKLHQIESLPTDNPTNYYNNDDVVNAIQALKDATVPSQNPTDPKLEEVRKVIYDKWNAGPKLDPRAWQNQLHRVKSIFET